VAGFVGIRISFEDRVVKGSGLNDIARQAERIAAIRDTAVERGVKLFINARTDVFFEHGDDAAQAVPEALERAKAYTAAGASGLFIPGLTDAALIGRIVEGTPLPVNVMIMDGVPSNDRLAELGVARISYGPIPYIRVLKTLELEAKAVSGRVAFQIARNHAPARARRRAWPTGSSRSSRNSSGWAMRRRIVSAMPPSARPTVQAETTRTCGRRRTARRDAYRGKNADALLTQIADRGNGSKSETGKSTAKSKAEVA
jgi:Phosphoenolpyruvate phosphomutase